MPAHRAGSETILLFGAIICGFEFTKTSLQFGDGSILISKSSILGIEFM